jgi:DNA topoisomerase-1
VEYDFTAEMENLLDEISSGKKNWKEVLTKFWDKFKAKIEESKDITITDVLDKVEADLKEHIFKVTEDNPNPQKCPECKDGELHLKLGKFGGFIGCSNYPDCKYTKPLGDAAMDINPNQPGIQTENEIGTDPKTGLKIYAKSGRYGPYVQLGENADKENMKRTSIPRTMRPEAVDLNKALFLLSLPKELGNDDDGEKLELGIGRYGPYVKKGGTYKTIPKEMSIFDVDLAEAKTLIAQAPIKKKTPAKLIGNHPKDNKPVELKSGRYGPYIQHGKTNASVPKSITELVEQTGQEITLDQALGILEAKKNKSKTKKKK